AYNSPRRGGAPDRRSSRSRAPPPRPPDSSIESVQNHLASPARATHQPTPRADRRARPPTPAHPPRSTQVSPRPSRKGRLEEALRWTASDWAGATETTLGWARVLTSERLSEPPRSLVVLGAERPQEESATCPPSFMFRPSE